MKRFKICSLITLCVVLAALALLTYPKIPRKTEFDLNSGRERDVFAGVSWRVRQTWISKSLDLQRGAADGAEWVPIRKRVAGGGIVHLRRTYGVGTLKGIGSMCESEEFEPAFRRRIASEILARVHDPSFRDDIDQLEMELGECYDWDYWDQYCECVRRILNEWADE